MVNRRLRCSRGTDWRAAASIRTARRVHPIRAARTIDGSWNVYSRGWEFATAPEHAEQWQLVPPWCGRANLDTHRFSKWGVELRNRVGPSAAAVLCGVSTDCCVLMTALAAVDDGAFVRVIADACGAKTQQAHEDTLALLQTRAPQLTITIQGKLVPCYQPRRRGVKCEGTDPGDC